MSGHPVQNYPDTNFVEIIDKIAEVVRCSIARGRCEIASRLITPGARKWVLHYGQELSMRKAHVDEIVAKLMSHFAIVQRTIAILGYAAPRTEMNFVNSYR